MVKKKEQLKEVVEETPAVVKEEPVVESTDVEESVTEEVVAEPEAEELEKVEVLEVDPEQLSKEISETKEELSVITEVRGELVKLYGDVQEAEKLKDTFKAENEQLKEQLCLVSVKLQEYQKAEEKLTAEKKLYRLEQLSAKFGALGQSKTVEHLSTKDEETLSEFEKIVDTALSRFGETAEMPSVTRNSQTEMLSDASDKKPSNEVAPAKPKETKKETLNDKNFFANVCNQLSGEQVSSGNGKKVLNF